MADTPLLKMREMTIGDNAVHVNTPILHVLDSFSHLTLQSTSLIDPPSNPQVGDAYWIPPGFGTATGAWAGMENQVVTYYLGWQGFQPYPGMMAYLQNSSVLARYLPSREWLTIASVYRQSVNLDVSRPFVDEFATGTRRPIMFAGSRLTLLQVRCNYRSLGDTGTLQFALRSGSGDLTAGSQQPILLFGAARLNAQAGDQLAAVENQPTENEWIYLEHLAVGPSPLTMTVDLHYSELL